jgi:hypothetical protein
MMTKLGYGALAALGKSFLFMRCDECIIADHAVRLFKNLQIAIEYASRVMERELHTSVFWVHASNIARFLESYQDVGVKARPLEQKDAEANMAHLACEWLSSDKCGSWLLIVDNVNAENVVTSLSWGVDAAAETTLPSPGRLLLSCIPQCMHGSIPTMSCF